MATQEQEQEQEQREGQDGFLELFVPGRICLFGEHSDWAGGYRNETTNKDIPVGLCLISGTHQGLYARVKKHDTLIQLHCKLDQDEEEKAEYSIDDENVLLRVAQQGTLWSYVCGVVHVMKERYNDIGGLVLDNYRTTLPVKKGLSSSAAVCVLTARALNRLYGLGLSVRDEMEYAYLGEICTPSRCGRMDQGCAYGPGRVILMRFDGPNLTVNDTVRVAGPIHMLLVDLCASKNTAAILSDLQQAYPTPQNESHAGLHQLLGTLNHARMEEALQALEQGSAERLGRCMTLAQNEFDRYATAVSPTHLASPVLHQLLQHPGVLSHVYGGKGVGSQGDGSAQLVAKSKQDQLDAIALIESPALNMRCLSLTLGGNEES